MRLVFKIDRDDISPARLEQYKQVLNVLIGYEGQWEVEPCTETAQKQPTSTDSNVNETGADAG